MEGEGFGVREGIDETRRETHGGVVDKYDASRGGGEGAEEGGEGGGEVEGGVEGGLELRGELDWGVGVRGWGGEAREREVVEVEIRV